MDDSTFGSMSMCLKKFCNIYLSHGTACSDDFFEFKIHEIASTFISFPMLAYDNWCNLAFNEILMIALGVVLGDTDILVHVESLHIFEAHFARLVCLWGR